MYVPIDAADVMRQHDLALHGAPGHAPAWPHESAWPWIEANHRYNQLLWDEEDRARRTDVPAEDIAASKRLIDQYNQQRNDAVEAIDKAILSGLGPVTLAPGARLSSETAGAMIDRLSILALKIFHMREQAQRMDASARHRQACHGKVERLMVQRADLGSCLDRLLQEAADGHAYFKMYHQFKMYNDPALNPYLYGKPGGGSKPGAAPP